MSEMKVRENNFKEPNMKDINKIYKSRSSSKKRYVLNIKKQRMIKDIVEEDKKKLQEYENEIKNKINSDYINSESEKRFNFYKSQKEKERQENDIYEPVDSVLLIIIISLNLLFPPFGTLIYGIYAKKGCFLITICIICFLLSSLNIPIRMYLEQFFIKNKAILSNSYADYVTFDLLINQPINLYFTYKIVQSSLK